MAGFWEDFAALVVLVWKVKIPLLEFLDACSPAGAAGYAIGRIGCFLSGDGDYGMPTSLPWGMSFPNGIVPTTERVHPTPLYEFFIWMAIAGFLWHMGTKATRGPKAKGELFCNYLLLTGVARFLIAFIRINPRSPRVAAAASASCKTRCLCSAVKLRRLGLPTTSESGREIKAGSAPALSLHCAAARFAPFRASQRYRGKNNTKRIPAHLFLFLPRPAH